MDFVQLRPAVSKALWQKDQTQFMALIHEALATASGAEYGRILTLQANWFLYAETQNAAQGLVLVQEALPLVRKNPNALLDALVMALALCFCMGDPERAREFEDEACSLLLQQGLSDEVRSLRHRLYVNLGHVATLRSDYATAYWYFVQAANNLADPAVKESERRSFASAVQLDIATACLRVRRYYEALEALDLAEQATQRQLVHFHVATWRAELLRQLGRLDEAFELLAKEAATAEACESPRIQARYYWVAALVAHDLGDVPGFHLLFAKAQEIAATQRLDFLLSEIQRFHVPPGS